MAQLSRGMTLGDGTGSRLDSVDLADGAGWQIESSAERDVFVKKGVTIEVRYTASDAIDGALKRGVDGGTESIGAHATAKVDQLRAWLTGQPFTAGPTRNLPEAYSTYDSGGWTRKDLLAAVEDPGDRAFLLRFLGHVDANGQLRSLGTHSRLHYGKRPNGSVFVYPFGRRFPPLKLWVKNGSLMVAGCWTGNWKISGHAGFSEIASILGQDESGPARAVPAAVLDPDELWEVAERVSRAIN